MAKGEKSLILFSTSGKRDASVCISRHQAFALALVPFIPETTESSPWLACLKDTQVPAWNQYVGDGPAASATWSSTSAIAMSVEPITRARRSLPFQLNLEHV